MTNEIEHLESVLKKASDAYYNTGKSIMSDAEYDSLERRLRELDPTNQFFLGVGATVRGSKVQLPFRMPSLDQLDEDDVEHWIKTNQLAGENIVITDKLDGVSVMLIYNKLGELQIAYSRGNGVEGQDITRHVRQIKSLPPNGPASTAIRAEIIIKPQVFRTLKNQIVAEANREFKNPRNFVAGQINASSALQTFYDHADIVAYEIIWPALNKCHQLELLERFEFTLPGFVTVPGSKITTDYLRTYTIAQVTNSVFELDGIVLDTDSVVVRQRLEGKKQRTSPNPAYAKKFKIISKDNVALTKVKSVSWRASKNGYVKPTVLLEPVNLTGVTISKATGFNAKFIIENSIGPGAEVEIVRSGDVIPYIKRVVTPAQSGPQLPLLDVELNETGVDYVLKTITNDVLFQQLLFSAKSLGVEFLAEKSLQKLFEAGHKTLTDLIELLNAPQTVGAIIGSDVMAEKGLASLRNSLGSATLDVIGEASGCFGRGIGAKKLKKILQHYNRLDKLTVEDVIKVDGFSEITAKAFVAGLPNFEEFLNGIKEFFTPVKETLSQPTSNQLAGLVFVFTGFRSAELEEKIIKMGGLISSAVNSKTTHLVAKDLNKQSSKMKKAAQSGVKVIDQASLMEMISEHLSTSN